MKCPKCNNEIERVVLVSECYQNCVLDENDQIVSYGSPDVQDTLRVLCDECMEPINAHVKDEFGQSILDIIHQHCTAAWCYVHDSDDCSTECPTLDQEEADCDCPGCKPVGDV